jgi:predicted kinase
VLAIHSRTTTEDTRIRGHLLDWRTMSESRLILTCGLPGAGKTTLALQLAESRRAVRLTSDDWIIALGSNPWDEAVRVAIEHELWQLAQQILRLGTSVVLDFGLWGRDERDEFRAAARDLGAGVELHYLEASTEELWRRIDERNAEPPWDGFPISRAHLEEWTTSFQAPDSAELALFDPPPQEAS